MIRTLDDSPMRGFNHDMANMSEIHQLLISNVREIALLRSTSSLLSWDEQTYMPRLGAEHRARQMALLARLSHEMLTAPVIGEQLAALESQAFDPTGDVAVNVREIRRRYDRAAKIPNALVEELARTEVLGQQAWVEAKRKSSFAKFKPWLARILDLKRQEAQCVGYEATPYDALLDDYEPHEKTAELTRVFQELRSPLVELVEKITGSSRQAPVEILERHYPREAQEKLARQAAERIGFSFEWGRLDVSAHPFSSTIGPGDGRITTRYDENYFGDAFFSLLHEVGHALYGQGLAPEHWGTPRGQSISLGIHESQSRMWENFVGRSRAFWEFFFGRTREVFGQALSDVTLEQWHFAVNDVRPSLIRTEADEATYNLHVLLRFELEQAMVTGDLSADDVPGAWNEKMRKYLGLTPPDDAKGCLQDIHWSGGSIGYFPTYTLGNLYAAQFFEQARKDLGDLDAMFARGEFEPLLSWLREKIHRHGMRYTARDLVERVTGTKLSAEPLLRHLRRMAEDLYGVQLVTSPRASS